MADIQSNIRINVDTSVGIAEIKNLQRQIAELNAQLLKSGAQQARAAQGIQRNLINNVNASGDFAARVRTISSTTESFTNALERNKLSMGQYFKYATGSTKTFGKIFKNEFNTIQKVAESRVKTLQTQYVKLGRDANGAMKAISVRPLALDMKNLATQTAIAAQKQQLFNQLIKQGSTSMLNFGKNTQWAGRQLMVGFTLPLAYVGGFAAKTFMKMEEQAIRFKRVYGDSFTPSAETDKMIEQVQDLASAFTKYGVAVEETLKMAADAAAMGKQGADLLAQVNQAATLAVLGGIEQDKALETTISLTNAFGIASEDLASKIDFLNAVENQTVTAIEDLTIAIPKAAPVIQQLGGDVEDLAFFLTAMKEGGINASEGANALKSGLARMINPTAAASDMLKGLGINITAIVEGNAGNIKDTVVEFAQALDTLDPLNRARAIEKMFGKFQFSRISTLFQNVIKDGSQAERVLQLTRASTQELAVLSERELKRVEDSPMYKFKKAVEDIKVSLVPLGEAFLKAITPVIEFAKGFLDRFNEMSDGAKNFAVIATTVIGGLGPVVLMTFGLIANGVANLIKMFAAIGRAFSGTGKMTNDLGVKTEYMTQQQLEAAAVAASLDQTHAKLIQTFSAEATAVDRLATAYGRAVVSQSRLLGVDPKTGLPIVAGNKSAVKRRAVVPPKQYASGTTSVPGPRGAGDIVPAMLSPGEAVIPVKQSEKYAGLIQGMMNDDIPGFAIGRNPFYSKIANARVRRKSNNPADWDKLVPEHSGWGLLEAAVRTLTGRRGTYGVNGSVLENKLTDRFLKSPNKKVAVRMFSDDLISSLGRGDKRYKNVFETGGKSRGSLDTAGGQRELAESKMFGFNANTPAQNRPAYGYVFNKDQALFSSRKPLYQRFNGGKRDPNDNVEMYRSGIARMTSLMNQDTYRYGNVALQLKRSALRGKTTTTIGDSLNSTMNNYSQPAKFGARPKDVRAGSPGRRSEFIEAQILGGFSYKDIKRIVSTEPRVIAQLQAALQAAGVKGVTVGMPKLTMMQRLRKAVDKNVSVFARTPRMQTEGKYANQYWPDPYNINGRLFYNKGVISVPGPKGAGDIVPAMLSPREAVIPAKMAEKYAPLISGMIAGNIPGFKDGYQAKEIAFPRGSTLESGHMSSNAQGMMTGKQAEEYTRKQINSLIDKKILTPGMVDEKAMKGIASRQTPLRPLTNTAGLITGTLNQMYTSGNSAPAASAVRKELAATKGMIGGSTISNLDYLTKNKTASPVTDKTMKKYLSDMHKSMDRQLGGLNDKQLTAKQLESVHRKAQIEAEKKIASASERASIRKANTFGRMMPQFAAGGSGGTGRSNAPVPLTGFTGAQLEMRKPAMRAKISKLSGIADKWLPQNKVRPTLKKGSPATGINLANIKSKSGQEKASRAIIAANGDQKKLDKIAKDINKGTYGPLVTATTSKTKTTPASSRKTPESKSTPATKPKPVSNVISRESLGNGITKTVSQTPAGRTTTRYYDGGKRVSETAAMNKAYPTASSGAKGGRPRLGAAAAGVGGAVSTAGMMMMFSGDEKNADMGGKLMMGGMALSMLPMLANPAVAVVAALAAAVAGFIAIKGALDGATKSGINTAKTMSMTSEKLDSLADFTGTASRTDVANKIRQDQLTGEGQKKSQFGQTFLESDAGKSMLSGVQKQIEGGDINVADNLANQLAYAVLQGVLDKDQASSIGAALSAELNDFSITAKVSGKLQTLLGPNGENVLTDPLKIAISIQEESTNDQMAAYDNAISEIESNASVDGGTIGNLIGGGIMVAIGGALVATGVGGALGLYVAGAGIGTMIASGVNEGIADGIDNAEVAAVAVQLGTEQISQNQGLLDSVDQRYASQLAELNVKKESAKTDEEILAIQKDISDKEKERDAALDNIKNKNSIIYDNLVAQAKQLGPAFNDSIGTSIDSRFANSSDAMKAAATLAKDSLSNMSDGDFKVNLQIGLASGELDPITVTNLINANAASGGELSSKFNLLVDAQGTADANQIIQLLGKAGVKSENYAVILDYINNSGQDFGDDMEALAQIANMQTEYGITIDLNAPNAPEIIGTIGQFVSDIEAMPQQVTLGVLTSYLSDYPNMDAKSKETIQGIMDNWDELSGGNQTVNREVLVDFAIGKADPAAILGFWLSTDEGQAASQTKQSGVFGSADRMESQQRTSLLDQAVAWFTGILGNTNADTGGGAETVDPGGKIITTYDNILNRLKQVRDASIDAAGGLTELLRVLGKSKNIEIFKGIDQQLISAGYGREFIDYINGLDAATRESFVKITDGVVKVTSAGKAMSRAFSEAALGDFQLSLLQGVSDVNMQFKAISKLRGAGMSLSEAFKVSEDANLAFAIATAASSAEVKKLVADFEELEAKQLELQLSTPEGRTDYLSQQFAKVQDYFSTQANAIYLQFDVDNKSLTDAIDSAQKDIAKDQVVLDDYNYGLSLLSKEEGDINEKYDERQKALDSIYETNQSLVEQSKAQLDVADALASGDLAAAAKAQREEQRLRAERAKQSQSDNLEKARKAELDSLKVTFKVWDEETGKQIEKTLTRKEIESEIETLTTNIATIEQERLQPNQRLLAIAEDARDVQIDNLDYLGKNASAWSLIEGNIQAAITKTAAYKQALIDAFSAVDGVDVTIGEDGVVDVTFNPDTIVSDDTTSAVAPAVEPEPAVVVAPTPKPDPKPAPKPDPKPDPEPDPEPDPPPKTPSKPTADAGYSKRWELDTKSNTWKKITVPKPPYNPGAGNKWTWDTFKDNWVASKIFSAPSVGTGVNPGMSTPYPSGAVSTGGYSLAPSKTTYSPYSSGGMVPKYFSVGGFARGTDTVPAMLTPGEFVVRKYAVDNFGTDKLKAINSGTYNGESVYNYSVNVNVKSDANPDQIARSVMTQIKQIDSQRIRSNRF